MSTVDYVFNNVWWIKAAGRSSSGWMSLLVTPRMFVASLNPAARTEPTNISQPTSDSESFHAPSLNRCELFDHKYYRSSFEEGRLAFFRTTSSDREDIKCANSGWRNSSISFFSRLQKNKELMTDIITNCKFKNGKRRHANAH